METQQPRPESNMLWAILSTLFCCLPFGIVSIIYASKVDGLYAAGDYEGAQKASDDAKKYAIIAAVAGIAVSVLYGIYVAVVGAAVLSQM